MLDEQNTILAFCTLYFTYSTTKVKPIAILNDLFVASHARGQGYGERLFTYALHYVKENGYATMSWKTAQDNETAQALYEKMGGVDTNAQWKNYEITLN
nr:GNAT family N-acetyltransferase [Fictibacillus macauensis]